MSSSFVKRAPDIAEEILAKTAAPLPADLRNFSKSLLTKEASSSEEKLALPPRMTLEDLHKLAFDKKTDLPKAPAVETEKYASVASDLRLIAKRAEDEQAQDVLETAAAMVLAGHEKNAIATGTPGFITNLARGTKFLKPPARKPGPFLPAAGAAPAQAPVPKVVTGSASDDQEKSAAPPPAYRSLGFWGDLVHPIRTMRRWQAEAGAHRVHMADVAAAESKAEAKRILSEPWKAKETLKAERERSKALGVGSEEREKTYRKGIKVLPALAAGTAGAAIGIPAALALTAPREKAKREEVKIYK